MRLQILSLSLWISACLHAAEPPHYSGIYPHLASFNKEDECGTGAVVEWADRLWFITYGPHSPMGSSDKLYEITPDLQQIIRPESIGGTPANRMIHRESQQLFIGPYAIDAERNVRTIPYAQMPGRPTGNARHLNDPANKIYYATMEEGLYEVDVKTLKVKRHIQDGNAIPHERLQDLDPNDLKSNLPGYHGKGLYSGQGQLIYANNGERDPRVASDPTIPSGALASWNTPGQDWQLIRRNQFTEVTGPGGIEGNANPETDPIWSIGWDQRSLILMCLHAGKWHSYRLPKGSHSYDGSHGWNTEWPRIRDIGEKDLLMTMHGTFWRFPRDFTPQQTRGIAPRSNYLKIIGDFTRWQNRLVFGTDDAAANEFMNKRKAKGKTAPAGQSQSNLWFVEPEQLDYLGPLIGHGAVWLHEDVEAQTISEPYLFSGYEQRSLNLAHQSDQNVRVTLEIDLEGNGVWQTLETLEIAPNQLHWHAFPKSQKGFWIRLKIEHSVKHLTALFHYRNTDNRLSKPHEKFAGLADAKTSTRHEALIHSRGADFKTLRAVLDNANDSNVYDWNGQQTLENKQQLTEANWQRQAVALPKNVFEYDAASVLYIDEQQRRWRLPRSSKGTDQDHLYQNQRYCREVTTERDLLNVHGTFYELPAENAGGFSKMRPISTHQWRIKDYCNYRGMLILSGVDADFKGDNPQLVKHSEGQMTLWAGCVDDLWLAGKPRGFGGPWYNTSVKANQASDPYLMRGYDEKTLTLSHQSTQPVNVTIQVDLAGTGEWVNYQTLSVPVGEELVHPFPDAFMAYWIRFSSDQDSVISAQLRYE